MSFASLRRLRPDEVPAVRRDPVEPKARAAAEPIVEAVRSEGEPALRRFAERFGELSPGDALVYRREVELKAAWESISQEERNCLARTAQRIRHFARSQRSSASEISVPIPGGEAGHTLAPVENAGCYAPGGRYPLPSTVLMTAVTARVAGCARVCVASPRPTAVTLAAAYIAEADQLIPVGGAQAIAALAYGAGPIGACDAVVGPGNMYVTAAKSLVSGRVAIDMLAGERHRKHLRPRPPPPVSRLPSPSMPHPRRPSPLTPPPTATPLTPAPLSPFARPVRVPSHRRR